jgi:type 1 fimbriae regulatory protein FimB/type 1 fimbriae regulatory protein FimE
LTTAHKKLDKCIVSDAKEPKMAAISTLKLVAPTNKKRTVAAPRRKRNSEYRSREHLTEREVEKLIEAAKDNRWGHRDATIVFLAFRHGLRASELVDLQWEQVDLENGILHVRRVKQGTPATHPLTGREMRALRRLQREASSSPFVFVSERGAPFTNRGLQAMVERAGKAAGFVMKIHPHMLRHACGYKLANDGVDTRTIQGYLGHKSIQHTVRYTELSPTRFKSLFRD